MNTENHHGTMPLMPAKGDREFQMDLLAYITPLRKWWWLLVAAMLIAGASSYVVAMNQPPFYQARTTLIIGRTIADPNPTTGQIALDKQLAETYAQIANRETVYNATAETLGLEKLPDFEARPVPDSQLIEIRVTDTSAGRAQAVANELAHQLILRSPTNPKPEELERQDFINQQLVYFEKQIEETQTDIENQRQQLPSLNSARQIADAQAKIDALQTKLDTMRATYTSLLASTQQSATNIISVLEPAELPLHPIGPNKLLISSMAALSGLILAAGAAYLMEMMGNTLNSRDEVERFLPYPIIGSIPEIKSEKVGTYTSEYPFSVVAESFRALRTNLEFSQVSQPLKTIMVTSPGVGEGKSTVASNLAFSMAQSDKHVILVGADLREPRLHHMLEIDNRHGLSDIFRGSITLDDALIPYANGHVKVIPSGSIPPNPTELLGSAAMTKILSELAARADIVVIDSSPFLVSDASVLAAKVDGVLIVVRPEHTRKELAGGMRQQVQRIGARVLGIALNRVPAKSDLYASYYGRYGLTDPEKEEKSMKKADAKRGGAVLSAVDAFFKRPGKS